MSDKSLKPCPFCGGEATVEQERFGRHGYYPKCTNSDCIAYNMMEDGEFGTAYVVFETKTDAMEAWNTRPIEDKLEAKITAAGDLLEQISAWMWKNHGMPEPMWADQFEAVCKMFEPEYKHE